MKKNKMLAFTVAMLLGVGSISNIISFATNATTNNEPQKFQKPENEIIGKITAISANSVTISLAERKMPENIDKNLNGQKPEFNGNNGQGFNRQNPPEPPKNENGEKPTFDFDNFFTLTGESTTIDISSASFDDFRRWFKDKNDTSNNTANTTTETTATKTYKDYSVGDYIAIELTSSTSKVAKSVRSANMMRGFGGFEAKQKPDANKTTQ